jgi:hypothetical protein
MIGEKRDLLFGEDHAKSTTYRGLQIQLSWKPLWRTSSTGAPAATRQIRD